MRLLVDEALQDAVAHRLATAGHGTTHIGILGPAGPTDDEVMALALALADNRILVTTDTDVGTILALTGADAPSDLLLRGIGASVDERVDALLDGLPRVEDELSEGAVIVIEPDHYRIRCLPIEDARHDTGQPPRTAQSFRALSHRRQRAHHHGLERVVMLVFLAGVERG